jgi:hypothetical protein
MRTRDILTGLVIGASGLGLLAAPAAGQPVPPSAPGPPAQRIDPGVAPGRAQSLVPYLPPPSDKEYIGLAESAPAEFLTSERVYALALVRARSAAATAAETLDPRALDEQARRHAVADFARFRKEFLAGHAEAGGAFRDPGGPYLAVLRRLQAINDGREHVAKLANLSTLVREMIQGEAMGLSQFDIDLTSEALARGRQRLLSETAGYRDALDELKVSLGLSPHAAVIPDRRGTAAFQDVFEATASWFRHPDRSLAALPRIIDRLPTLGDVVVDSQPLLRTIEQTRAFEQAPTRPEEVLRDAARLALKSRMGAAKDRAANHEDVALELRVRRRIRRLTDTRRDYEGEKRRFELAIRLKDQAFERLFSPPSGAPISLRSPAIQGLINELERIPETEDRMVALWATFQAERLALYRDLGVLPYDNWAAFYDDLSARPGAAGPAPAATPAAAPPPPEIPPRGGGERPRRRPETLEPVD